MQRDHRKPVRGRTGSERQRTQGPPCGPFSPLLTEAFSATFGRAAAPANGSAHSPRPGPGRHFSVGGTEP